MSGFQTVNRWLIVDCPNLCWRAFHTTGHLDNGVILGLFRDALTLPKQLKCNRVVFCWDRGKGLREERYPCYKMSRRTEGWEWSERVKCRTQMRELRERWLPELGYKNILSQSGYEADDLIAAVAHGLPAGDSAVIVSSDQDLYQLLSSRVTMYKPATKALYTVEHLAKAYHGLSPEQWHCVKILAGCKGDGVPGVFGVGESIAAKFLRGKLGEKSAAFKKITEACKDDEFIKRNTWLVKLPLPGLEPIELQTDEVTEERWRKVLLELKMPSLLGKL